MNAPQLVEHPSPEFRNNPNYNGILGEISINLTNACEENPHPEMSEICKTNAMKYVIRKCVLIPDIWLQMFFFLQIN